MREREAAMAAARASSATPVPGGGSHYGHRASVDSSAGMHGGRRRSVDNGAGGNVRASTTNAYYGAAGQRR